MRDSLKISVLTESVVVPRANMSTAPSLSQELMSGLLRLQEYMHNFYPNRDISDFPVEFWRNPDDDLYWETLLYFPLFVGGCIDETSPIGFRIAYPIFHLEDDYMINGWTALTNAGEDRLPSAVWAYREIGLASEAAALGAALESIRQSPDDEAAAEAAYKAANIPEAADESREKFLFEYFTANRALFELKT